MEPAPGAQLSARQPVAVPSGRAGECGGEGWVSHRLLRLEIPVFPERRMFRIHDAGVDLDAPGGPLLPVGTLASLNREQLWVGSLQEHVPVKVVLEEWRERHALRRRLGRGGQGPALPARAARFDMGSAGPAIAGVRLAGGVGEYSVRVSARNREQVFRLYHELFDRYGDPLGDEFQRARMDLKSLEQYLTQLWRQS